MKKLILNTLTLFLMLKGFGQTTAEILSSKTHKVAVDTVAEALANLALENPQIKIAELGTGIAEQELKITRASWLNTIYATGNLNEFSFKEQSSDLGNRYYPKYNFGMRVSVGEFFTIPKAIKAGKLKVQASEENLKLARQTLRSEVITAYQDYALTQKLIALEQDVLQDDLIAFSKTEEKFKNEEISIEKYTEASKIYNSGLVKVATLNRDLKVKQAALEALIGMPLDNAYEHLRALQQAR